jgi:predicted enzyme related to lactoylglutathione lyase
MEIQVITITVSDLERSKQFFESILGFKIQTFNEATKWLSFQFDSNSFIAIEEQKELCRNETKDQIDFVCDDVEALWSRIQDKAVIVEELKKTDWGSYQFVVKDPDGMKLGFVQKPKSSKLKFDLIGLFVENIQNMVEFYRDVIGIECDWDGKGPYAEFKHEGIRFSMFERKELPHILLGQTPDYPKKLNGTFELAINAGKPENVDILFDQIIAKGGKLVYPPRNEPWKMRSAMLADPEGNMIEIGSDFWE